jgi:hypothetical protein
MHPQHPPRAANVIPEGNDHYLAAYTPRILTIPTVYTWVGTPCDCHHRSPPALSQRSTSRPMSSRQFGALSPCQRQPRRSGPPIDGFHPKWNEVRGHAQGANKCRWGLILPTTTRGGHDVLHRADLFCHAGGRFAPATLAIPTATHDMNECSFHFQT